MKRSRARGRKPKQAHQGVELVNPVADQFESFIFGNSLQCERVVQQDSMVGKALAICGAGPTLRDTVAHTQADHIWGVNSALPWLWKNGHRPTHGITVDQTPAMVAEWAEAPPVEYLLASSCHPDLAASLIAKGYPVTFFHNYVGVRKPPLTYADWQMEYEDLMYAGLYPGTVRAGSGLNSVNRALDVALFAGYDKIYVLGADCALRPNGDSFEMHADGGDHLASGASAMTWGGEIDGRRWDSKIDMLISAVWLVRTARGYPGRVEIVGDTLPNAIKDKPDEFLLRFPVLTDHAGQPIGFEEMVA